MGEMGKIRSSLGDPCLNPPAGNRNDRFQTFRIQYSDVMVRGGRWGGGVKKHLHRIYFQDAGGRQQKGRGQVQTKPIL